MIQARKKKWYKIGYLLAGLCKPEGSQDSKSSTCVLTPGILIIKLFFRFLLLVKFLATFSSVILHFSARASLLWVFQTIKNLQGFHKLSVAAKASLHRTQSSAWKPVSQNFPHGIPGFRSFEKSRHKNIFGLQARTKQFSSITVLSLWTNSSSASKFNWSLWSLASPICCLDFSYLSNCQWPNQVNSCSNPGRAPLSVPDLKKISILDLSSSLFVSFF